MGSQRYRRNYSLNAQNHGVAMYDRQRGPISNVPTDLTVGGDPPAADLGGRKFNGLFVGQRTYQEHPARNKEETEISR